jgi:transposase
MAHTYSSNISRKQFDKIKPILESARKKTRPRSIDLYDVVCAILYLLKSGCQWRMLPREFPKWRTCHYYFNVWSYKANDASDSVLEKILKKIGWRSSTKQGSERKNEFYNR